MTVALTIVFVVEYPSSNPTSKDEATIIPALSQLCTAWNPNAETYKFSLMDQQTNETHVIYANRLLNVQVTNVLRRGQLVYTEVIDFAKGRMAIYPDGRIQLNEQKCFLSTVCIIFVL